MRLPAEIGTARLVLRAPEEEDREPVIALLRHPETGKTYMVPELSCREEADRLFDALVSLSRREGRTLYGIRAGGETVGIIHDLGEAAGGEVEVGYAIRPEYWGRGYCTEALAAVLEALFAAGAVRVRAAAFEGNGASLRVMEKCGMRPTGETETVEYRGQTRRCVCRALRREEYPAACAERPDMIR